MQAEEKVSNGQRFGGGGLKSPKLKLVCRAIGDEHK
jgi:hypothetical protein